MYFQGTHALCYTVKSLYSGHLWDQYKCPDYRGVLISGVNLYYKAQFGTFVSVLNTGVSSFQGVLDRGVSLYAVLCIVVKDAHSQTCDTISLHCRFDVNLKCE